MVILEIGIISSNELNYPVVYHRKKNVVILASNIQPTSFLGLTRSSRFVPFISMLRLTCLALKPPSTFQQQPQTAHFFCQLK